MHQRVQYPDTIEPLVQFIEQRHPPKSSTAPWRSCALAPSQDDADCLGARRRPLRRPAARPSWRPAAPARRPARHHQPGERLDGEDTFLPILQHVALSNKHINDPVTAPYSLLEFAPLDPSARRSAAPPISPTTARATAATTEGIEAAKEAFLKACSRGEASRRITSSCGSGTTSRPMEAFDLLMSVALPRMRWTTTTSSSRGYLWRAMETLGTEHLKVLFRPAVRYVARFPAQRLVPEADALIEQHGLLNRILRQRTGDDETAKIGELGEAIRAVKTYTEIPKMIAQALADGLSLEGAGEALSIGAAGLFLRSLTGNPMDVHLHTSANLRRYLIRLDGFSMKNKLLTLLLWHTGPEVKSTQYRMEPELQPEWRRSPRCRTARRRSCSRRSPRVSTPSRRLTGRR